MDGYRSLEDGEVVAIGDVVKDIDAGEYRLVSDDTIDGLLIGLPAKAVRQWLGVNDVLRMVPNADVTGIAPGKDNK